MALFQSSEGYPLGRSDNFEAIHADKYKIDVIFKNSEGWTVMLPTPSHLEAPPALVPIFGKKTKNNANKLARTIQNDHLFKKSKEIL